MGFYDEVKRLGMNYATHYEINSDIVNFKIKLPKDPDMKQNGPPVRGCKYRI